VIGDIPRENKEKLSERLSIRVAEESEFMRIHRATINISCISVVTYANVLRF